MGLLTSGRLLPTDLVERLLQYAPKELEDRPLGPLVLLVRAPETYDGEERDSFMAHLLSRVRKDVPPPSAVGSQWMTTSEIPTVRAPSQEAPDEDQVELLAELGNEVHCLVPLLLGPSKQQLRLGRSPSSDIYLPDPSVSGEHAELTVEDGGVRIFDRHSKNGTYLNGQRLEATQAPWLQPMDRLSFGRVRAFACEPRTLRAVVRQDLRAMF